MKRALPLAVFVVLGMVAVVPAFADSITTVALQDNGFVSISLTPTHDPLLNPTSAHSVLDFITSFGPVGAVTFSSTLTLGGQTFDFGPFTDSCTNPGGCGVIFGWTVPVSYKPIAGVLAVNLNGVTTTYDFRFQTPVPEPTTMILAGTGLMAVITRRILGRVKLS